jgi:dipeptidyl aminopeptidase/acylaminoacyl peptidase
VLLIHGSGDETVPVAHGMRLAESIGDVVRFVPIDGGDHHLRNVDRNAVIKEITDWLNSH